MKIRGDANRRTTGKKGLKMDFESIWYEHSPKLYIVLGFYFLWETDTKIGIFASALLIAASGAILGMRWAYRNKNPGARRGNHKRNPAGVTNHQPPRETLHRQERR